MINDEFDETILAEHISSGGVTTGGTETSVLSAVWRALLDGAAMYGAAIHGYPFPDDSVPDIACEANNQ